MSPSNMMAKCCGDVITAVGGLYAFTEKKLVTTCFQSFDRVYVLNVSSDFTISCILQICDFHTINDA